MHKPEPKGGRAHSPAGEGLGESQFRRLEKKLSTLPTLWLYGYMEKLNAGGQGVRQKHRTASWRYKNAQVL